MAVLLLRPIWRCLLGELDRGRFRPGGTVVRVPHAQLNVEMPWPAESWPAFPSPVDLAAAHEVPVKTAGVRGGWIGRYRAYRIQHE